MAPSGNEKLTFRMAFTSFACFIGGPFLVGWHNNCVGLPGDHIKKFINASLDAHYGAGEPEGTDTLQKVLFSIVILLFQLGGAIGGFSSAVFADKLGRRRTILLTHVFGLITGILYATCKLANSFEMLLLSRLIAGFAGGCCFATVPVYTTEITPRAIRGAVGTASQLSITIGIFISTIFVLEDTLGSEEFWPVGMACGAFFSAISAVMLISPLAIESPKWLFIVRRDEHAAAEALRKLYNREDVSDLLDEIRAEANGGNTPTPGQQQEDEKWTFSKLFSSKQLRWPLIIVVSLNAAQQFTGINIVFFYAGELYKSAGLGVTEASYAALAVNGINVLATIVAMPLIERWGRRPLLIYPMISVCITLVLQVVLLVLKDYLPGLDEATLVGLSWGAIVAVGLFVISFAVGLGPIPNFSASEMFRPGPRASAAAIAAAVNLTSTLLVSVLFDNVLKTYLGPFSFLPFVVLSLLFLILFWFKFPETKNRPISDIYRDMGCPDDNSNKNSNPMEMGTIPAKV